ncbi:MAG: hypothetical protein HC912_09850, partial [Saprospiraceae bacterium]|nr:hypothetical protein [Saprospiraceae bacterium]
PRREAAGQASSRSGTKNAQEARQREEEAKQVAAAAQRQQEQLQIQVAKYLLGTGMPVAQIAQMTGLSEEVVLNLR